MSSPTDERLDPQAVSPHSAAGKPLNERLTVQIKAHRITRAHTALLVVDFQERLLPAISDHERVLQNALRMVKGAVIFGLPTLVTEQYRKGLGGTVPQLASALPDFKPIEKLTFSAGAAPGVIDSLRAQDTANVILCGIEAHVCVCQTCLDLLEKSFNVVVVADAISSRTPQNHQMGLERMREAGAVIASTEMVLFELLERACTDEFKQILALVK